MVRVRVCPGFPRYRVTDMGIVLCWWYRTRRLSAPRRLSQRAVTWDGHYQVSLWREGRWHMAYVHRLVLEAFVGPCPDGMECRHLNGNPSDNRLENLSWGTHKENGEDMVAHDRSTKGERNRQAKLTEDRVRYIRRRYAEGGVSYSKLGEECGIHFTVIGHVVRRTAWRHVL